MSKRRLSKQQTERLRHRREASGPPQGAEQQGLVLGRYGKQVDVECAEHGLVRCHMRANLADVVAGDRVAFCLEENADASMRRGVVTALYPRQTELVRPDSFGKLKPVAANITRMVITLAPQPQAHTNLIDRYLVVAEDLGFEAMLLINKRDLIDSAPELSDLLKLYQSLDYPTLQVSARFGDGMDALRQYLSRGASIFVGQSGVGKSSVIQALLPDEPIKIGHLSAAEQKGRHTTTHARLYHFPSGGQCVDSPGIREFGLWHMSAEAVARGFREFRPHLQCKFRNCSHRHEPGCGLLQALADGLIDAGRFDSYRQIVDSLDQVDMRAP